MMSARSKPSRTPPGPLPTRFRKPRLLIIGCGDIGLRVVKCLHGQSKRKGTHPASHDKFRIIALTSSPERVALLRAHGITPIPGNLDNRQTLRRLAGIATHVVHLAPPASTEGERRDLRTYRLTRVLLRTRGRKPHLIYASTSAVYGDAQGAKIDETRPLHARTPRALRRVDAEQTIRTYGHIGRARSVVLRVPGIYAPSRDGGTPKGRLLNGLPVLAREDDVYTSHIHAQDLARTICAALWLGAPQRSYNVNDDTELLMGDYVDLAADLYGLTRPPRVSREQAALTLSPMQLSFMQDSRRLSNTRLKKELRIRLRYPTVSTGLLAG